MVLVAGLVRGREHSAIIRAMNPISGVLFAGPDKLVYLIGLVKPSRAGGGVSRIAGTGTSRPETTSPIGTNPHLRFTPLPQLTSYSPLSEEWGLGL